MVYCLCFPWKQDRRRNTKYQQLLERKAFSYKILTNKSTGQFYLRNIFLLNVEVAFCTTWLASPIPNITAEKYIQFRYHQYPVLSDQLVLFVYLLYDLIFVHLAHLFRNSLHVKKRRLRKCHHSINVLNQPATIVY